MKDQSKTKSQLIEELKILRNQLSQAREISKKKYQSGIDSPETLKLLNSIVKSVPDIIYRLDPNGKIVFINDTIKEYGYDPQELIGKDIFKIVHPEDRERAVYRVNERRTGERRTRSFEIRFLTKQKKYVHFDIHSKGIYAEPVFLLEAEGLYSSQEPRTESFRGSQGIARDITQRKLAESILTESEERFRSIVEKSHIGICIIDEQFRFTYVNNELMKILGYPKKEMLGKNFQEFLLDEDKGILTERFRRRQKGEKVPNRYEIRIHKKDGEERILELISAVIKDSLGKRKTIVQILDITKKKTAEKALSESENKFRQLFQNANDGIYLWELKEDGTPGLCLEANDKACKMLGYNKAELLKMEPKAVYMSEVTDTNLTLNEQLLSKNHGTFEMFHLSKEGKKIPVEISSHKFNLNGKKVILSITRDITQRKIAEMEVRESEAKLKNVIDHVPIILWAIDKSGTFTFSEGRGLKRLGFKPGEVVGRSLFKILENNKQIISDTRKALKGHKINSISVVGGITFETQYTPFFNKKGEVIGATGIAIDISDRVKSANILRRKNLQQEILLETARYLTESLDLDEVLTRIANGAKDIIKVDGCTIYLLEDDAKTLNPVVCIDPNYEKEILSTPLSIDASFTGQGIKAKRTLIFNDAGKDEAGQHIPGTPEEEEENIIVAPFIVNKKVLGAMCLNRLQKIFTEEDLSLAETFAVYASTALKNAQIHSDLLHEINERKSTEKALKDSEERFRNLAEESPNMIFINVKGRIVYANNKCVEIMEYKRPEFYSPDFSFFKLIAPESRDKINENFKKHLNGEDIAPYEYTLVTKSGKTIEALITTKLFKYGGEQAILGIITDIGEQKEVEEALKISEEKYRRFFEDDLTGDFISTPDGRLLACNSAYLRIFGFNSEEEAYNCNVENHYLSPQDRKAFLRLLEKEKIVEYHEMEFRRFDGKPVFVIANMSGDFDEKGKLKEIRGYFFDNTERKILEQQFRQAQKMEAVGRLAGGVAHDFNNLLTVIKGYSEILLRRINPSDQLYNDISQIKLAGDKAASLTNQLLAFSRRQVMKPKLINPNNIVSDLENMLQRLIGEDIELLTVMDPKAGYIKADPSQLEQVIMNLVVNARDAMPEGGKLTIETANVVMEEGIYQQHMAVQPPGSYIMLSISDTGVGIDKETQARIFEPFFTTKDRGKGTGLGLSTVYGIIKQSGGFIWVYSEQNQGTTFKIYFPKISKISETKTSKRDLSDTYHGNESILLVEDEDMVRELAKRVLVEYGYKVFTAENGEKAEILFNKNKSKIDMLVTDLVMPGINGNELASRISEVNPEIKILYISGYSDEAVWHHNNISIGSEYLQKPFNPQKFVRRIREILDKDF